MSDQRQRAERWKGISAYHGHLHPFSGFPGCGWKKAQFRTPHLNPFSSAAMATELPYAADAEVSLSYDELDVYIFLCFPAAIDFVYRCLDASTKRNSLNRTSPSRPNSTMHGVL